MNIIVNIRKYTRATLYISLSLPPGLLENQRIWGVYWEHIWHTRGCSILNGLYILFMDFRREMYVAIVESAGYESMDLVGLSLGVATNMESFSSSILILKSFKTLTTNFQCCIIYKLSWYLDTLNGAVLVLWWGQKPDWNVWNMPFWYSVSWY